MKILLTGHNGYIGSALHTVLQNAGHTVFGIDLKTGDDLLFFDKWPENIDVVIHLAGKSGVRESIKDPASYWMNNIEASKRLFARYGDKCRIIYASSSSAYEPDLNPYAASKYCLEELAERYPDTLGLRFHTVYSENCRSNMLFYKLLNDKLEYVTRHYRDFVHLDDVLDAIMILINKSHIKGICDVGTGIPIKVQELAPDLPVRLNTPGEREFTCANIELLLSLGWKPKYSIKKFLTNNNLDNIINIFNGETV